VVVGEDLADFVLLLGGEAEFLGQPLDLLVGHNQPVTSMRSALRPAAAAMSPLAGPVGGILSDGGHCQKTNN
jgi:hypothetical protein